MSELAQDKVDLIDNADSDVHQRYVKRLRKNLTGKNGYTSGIKVDKLCFGIDFWH